MNIKLQRQSAAYTGTLGSISFGREEQRGLPERESLRMRLEGLPQRSPGEREKQGPSSRGNHTLQVLEWEGKSCVWQTERRPVGESPEVQGEEPRGGRGGKKQKKPTRRCPPADHVQEPNSPLKAVGAEARVQLKG